MLTLVIIGAIALSFLAWGACKVGADADQWQAMSRQWTAEDKRLSDAARIPVDMPHHAKGSN